MNRRRLLRLAALLATGVVAARSLGAQGTPPPAGPLRPYEFPKVAQFTLANGVKVLLVERHTLPIVTTRVILDAGASREPAEQNGLAVLTGNLLREGTRKLTGAQIAERMEAMGANFTTSGSSSLAYVDVTALNTVFGDALALAATTIIEPSFPEREFIRAKNEGIAGYEQSQASVEGLANEAFYRGVFAPEAPLSRLPEGTKETLSGLVRDDVVNWHRTMYAPGNTVVLLVGAITVPEARRVIERAFGSWKAESPKLGELRNPARPLTGTRVVLIDRSGSVQSGIQLGQVGVLGTDPDYLTMVVLNRVLGGGSNARINMNLRERHGYTYGAGSFQDIRRGGGAFVVSSSVRTSATDSALVEAVAEYRRIVAEVVPADELGGAINNLVASFPQSVQTIQALRVQLQRLILWGLPLDFYASYRERLSAVTAADVQRAAKKRLTPDALVIVVAGDLAKIEQPIRARNLGTVEVWDAAGNRLR